jgi:hypothetical protein
MRPSFRYAAVLFAVSLLVACGGSKSSIDTSKVLTKAQYIEASDAICNTFINRINGIVSSAGNDLSLEAAKSVLTQRLIPLFQDEHKALLRLIPPKRDTAQLQAALSAMNSGINTIIAKVSSAKTKEELDALNPRDIAAWKTEVGNYGMHICGSKPTTTTSQ